MEFFKINKDFVQVTLNPNLYDLEAVYSAGYQTIEYAYIFFEGDPEKEIVVNLSLKDESLVNEKNLELVAKRFMNSLINYTFNKINSKKKEFLRALLLRKSFESIDLADYDESDGYMLEENRNNLTNNIENKSEPALSTCDCVSEDECCETDDDLDFDEEALFEDDDVQIFGSENKDDLIDNSDDDDVESNDDSKDLDDAECDVESNDTTNDSIDDDLDFEFDDPDGIAIPWEEKYGKSSGDSDGN
jgi:His-Xaa-Ser system protein HxsD